MAALVITTATRLPGGMVYLRWTVGDFGPPYRIFVNGVHVDTTQATELRIYVPEGETPPIDVIDDPDEEPEVVRSSRLTLGWSQSSDVDHYRVERFISSTWTEIGRVKETGDSAYSFRTPVLDDDTTHQLRVVPVGSNGLDGTAQQFNDFKVIRHPDVPDVAFLFDDGTAKVTITEN